MGQWAVLARPRLYKRAVTGAVFITIHFRALQFEPPPILFHLSDSLCVSESHYFFPTLQTVNYTQQQFKKMASAVLSNVEEEQPISRTYQYRKVMKPMLERKRRARINRCLDELKELMSSALASEGENLTKLEKADVLELTVRHLHKLRERQALGLSPSPSSPGSTQDKFRAGFTHCAAEVSRYLATSTGLDVTVGQRLLSHLGRCVHQLEAFPASGATIPSASYTPPSSPTQQQQQQQSELRSIHRSSVLPPLPVSPALSDVTESAGPCDYSKYSIRSDLYSPSVAAVSDKVWRPW